MFIQIFDNKWDFSQDFMLQSVFFIFVYEDLVVFLTTDSMLKWGKISKELFPTFCFVTHYFVNICNWN